jgi:triacylglycerol esterase/lipase EstA (alpha/beta hydrolase family)
MTFRFFLLLLLSSVSINATESISSYQQKSGFKTHCTAASKEIPALIKKLFMRVDEPKTRDPEREAVLLIHGLNASSSDWYLLAPEMRQAGLEVYTIDLAYFFPKNGYEKSVQKILKKANQILQTHDTLSIVGHSLGGVAALDTVNRLDGRVKKLITVNSPLNGTTMSNRVTNLVLPRHLSHVFKCNGPFCQNLLSEAQKSQQKGVKTYHIATENDHLVPGVKTCFLPHFEAGLVIHGSGHLSTLNEPLVRRQLIEWLTNIR